MSEKNKYAVVFVIDLTILKRNFDLIGFLP